jgi:hypothetical protein
MGSGIIESTFEELAHALRGAADAALVVRADGGLVLARG